MPKIIENLPERLTQEAWRQIKESGYSAMTIRSVAKACGVGVGTVYNYYRSKEALVAAFMLKDWKDCIAQVYGCAEQDKTAVLREIHRQLTAFISRYGTIFEDKTAAISFSGTMGGYHGMLRSQLADPLRKFCKDDFTAEFIAEAMLTWTVAGKSFEELNSVLNPLF